MGLSVGAFVPFCGVRFLKKAAQDHKGALLFLGHWEVPRQYGKFSKLFRVPLGSFTKGCRTIFGIDVGVLQLPFSWLACLEGNRNSAVGFGFGVYGSVSCVNRF